jgi:hypothetical protein
MKTVIIFNAPPNSGKDACCEYLAKQYNAHHTYFKKALYDVAAKTSGLPLSYIRTVCTDRKYKEFKNAFMMVDREQVTPRQYLIHVSENVVKPLLGKSYFGNKIAEEIVNTPNNLIVVSDGGFEEELLPLLNLPDTEVIVVRLYRDGCNFNNDSRKYFTDEFLDANNITSWELYNTSDLEGLYCSCESLMKHIQESNND